MESIISIWNNKLFTVGGTQFTLGSVVVLLIAIFLLFYLTGNLKKFLIKRLFPKYNIDKSAGVPIATLIRYTILLIGLVIVFQTSGINLSSLGILFGALGIGIGFGLQSITSNFISGLIILFEKPVKIGDRVEMENITGNIVNISARATTIINNDNIAIVVPNSDLINNRVINWSLNDRNVRLNFPVGVSYNEDPEKIKKILLEVAHENPGVLKAPPPDVLFNDFGDSSLNFLLRIWTFEYSSKPTVLKSQLYYAIFEKFKEHNIEIPLPQRDLHLKSGFSEDMLTKKA